MKWERHMRHLPNILIGFTIGSKKWESWDNSTLTAVEQFLIHDFAHDSLLLDFQRLSGKGQLCRTEALWAMKVS